MKDGTNAPAPAEDSWTKKPAEALKHPFDPSSAGSELISRLKSKSGGAWSEEEFKEHFSLSAEELRRRRDQFQIVYWRDANLRFHYPRWQINDDKEILPGIAEILSIFQSTDEWRVMRYFLSARHQLGGRAPLDLLHEAEATVVIAHAAEQFFESTW